MRYECFLAKYFLVLDSVTDVRKKVRDALSELPVAKGRIPRLPFLTIPGRNGWHVVLPSKFCFSILAAIMSEEPHEIRIDTPDGEVIAHDTKVESSHQAITVIDGDELSWLQSLDADAPKFVSHYVPNVTQPGLKDYDTAFRAWQLDKSSPYTDEEVVELVGSCLANKCISDFNMEWVTVTDDYGTDYAIRGIRVEIMSFPFSTVRKRIEDNNYDFVNGVYYTIKEMLSNGDCQVREPQ